MTQTRDLLKKIADFFTGEEFYEKGEDARLELSPDDVRCMYDLIKQGNNVPVTNVGDLISRQAAIVALANNRCGNDEWDLAVTHDVETIKKIPSAEPERPRGK